MDTQAPQWVSLDSSSVDQVSYDKDTRTLRVQFKTGRLYTYSNVPEEVYKGLIYSNSPGRVVRDVLRGYNGRAENN